MEFDHAIASLEKSTIVRTTNEDKQKRRPSAALRLVDRFAPGLLARVVEHQMFRPPKRSAPRREAELLVQALPLRVGLGRHRLRAWSWAGIDRDSASGIGTATRHAFRLPPTVLLVHGWAGRGGQLSSFVEPLTERGFRVVAFDAPGHGQSPGRRTSIPTMGDAILETAAWVGGVDAIVAHSAGAAATTWAIERGLAVDRLAFVAPVDDISSLVERHARATGLRAGMVARVRTLSERRLGLSWSSLRVSGLAVYRHEPLLVIHDRDDSDVPWTQSRRIVQAWNGAETHTTRGLGHRRILRDDGVVRRVADFLHPANSQPAARPVRHAS